MRSKFACWHRTLCWEVMCRDPLPHCLATSPVCCHTPPDHAHAVTCRRLTKHALAGTVCWKQLSISALIPTVGKPALGNKRTHTLPLKSPHGRPLTHWGRSHLNCLNARSQGFLINFNPLNAELNPICYLLALLAHHFLHVSSVRVKSLSLRLLMSYIYIYIYIYIYMTLVA